MHPTDNPGFLLHHLACVIERQSDSVLQEKLGIGFSQFKILMALKRHEGVQQRQIADALGQTEASISRQIKLMHDQGLLTSRVSPKSRREHVTTLTHKGNRVAERAFSLLNTHHAPLFARLTSHQQANLKEILSTMHESACHYYKSNMYHHHD